MAGAGEIRTEEMRDDGQQVTIGRIVLAATRTTTPTRSSGLWNWLMQLWLALSSSW